MNKTNKIIKRKCIKKNRIRQYSADVSQIKQLLINSKNKSKITSREIAVRLNRPITHVQHWFRRDSSFTLPDALIWNELKRILKINNNEYDKFLTSFIEKDSNYDMSNRAYDTNGIAPTITCNCGNYNYIVYSKDV